VVEVGNKEESYENARIREKDSNFEGLNRYNPDMLHWANEALTVTWIVRCITYCLIKGEHNL
jgi:hypothetical protein